MHQKPFSQACANNQAFILKHLQRITGEDSNILEIGSGTGQHACYFAAHLINRIWQTSDRACNHAGINLWIDDVLASQAIAPDRLLRPLTLDVMQDPWPKTQYDTIFSANTAHIMPWQAVVAMFEGTGQCLNAEGTFILYGPFNYGCQFTSESNRRFDAHLKENNPEQGIRNIEDITALAQKNQLVLEEDNAMPANNRLLVFRQY